MKRSALSRKSRIRPVNAKRRRERFERNFGPEAEAVRQMPCLVCAAPPPSDPHHWRTRGAGGTSKDMVPLCRKHHLQAHAWGRKTFAARYGLEVLL